MRKRRFLSVILCGMALLACLSACGKYQSLEEITDEDLRSGGSHCSVINWTGNNRNGTYYHLSWGTMNGYTSAAQLTAERDCTVNVTYTVEGAGEGYRVVLLLPDDTLIDMAEGTHEVALPAGTTKVMLAAVETSGAFSLEVPEGSGAFLESAPT